MMARLLAAVAGVAVLTYWLPRTEGDSLRGTLALLPLVVAGLLELYRWARRERLLADLKLADSATGGATRRPGTGFGAPAMSGAVTLLGNRPGWVEGIALGVLVLLAFGRHALAPAFDDRLLMAGLVLLLAVQVARLVGLLRPSLGSYLPRRIPAAFFFLPLIVYLAILPWSIGQRPADGDEPYFLLVTHSLAHDFDTDLSNNYAAGDWRHFMEHEIEPQPGDPVAADGEQRSRHSPLLPLLLVPAYLVGGRLGAVVLMAALTAALAWMSLRLAARYFPSRPDEALAGWALLAFSAPLLLYSHQIWAEVPAALLVLLALDRILDLGDDRETPAVWLGVIVTIVLLPLLKLRFALLALPLMALAIGRSRRRPLLLAAVAVAGLAGAVLMLNNWLRYGNLLRYRGWREVAIYDSPAADFARGLAGLFYDSAFGLFATAPLWMLLLPAVVALAAYRSSFRLHLPLLILPMLLFVIPRLEWYGGWAPPFRYGVVVLPLLALALVPLLVRARRWRQSALVAGLAAATFALTLIWVVLPGWTYNLAHGRSHLLDSLSARFGADVARLFPSAVRSRPATWIWIAVSLAVAALWYWWAPRRRSRVPAATGVVTLLLLLALLPVAAQRLPSRVIEIEDPQVKESGGALYPKLWVVARPRFRGGWRVHPGDRISAPVVAGGEQVSVEITLHHRPSEPGLADLRISAGDWPLATWPGEECRWCTVRFDDLFWPEGEPLVLAMISDDPSAKAAMIIDQVRFEWADPSE